MQLGLNLALAKPWAPVGEAAPTAPAAPVLSVVEPVTNPPAFDVDLPSGNGAPLDAAAGDVLRIHITLSTDTGFASVAEEVTATLSSGDIASDTISVSGLDAQATGTYIARARLERGGVVSDWSSTTDSFALSAFTENFVVFDGSNDYLSRSPDFTGAADAKTALIFASVDFANTASAAEYVLDFFGSRTTVRRTAGAAIRVLLSNTSGTGVIDLLSSDTIGAERVNILAAADADGTSRLYLWTESAGAWASEASDATGGGANLDFTNSSYGIGALYSSSLKLNGSLARVALWTGIAVPDITDSAVRAKFCDATTGVLVNPTESRTAYGTPIVDYYGTASEWNAGTNKGSGGNMTMNGAVTDAA